MHIPTIQSLITMILPILLCLTLHELAHGLMALACGDDTAKQQGRLTLNPFAHLDPIGTLLLMFCGFGYARPVPVNMYRLRHPKWDMALVALAGPAMNLLISAICLTVTGFFRIGSLTGYIAYQTALLSLGLAVFNLIPIPPLDGSRILFALLPERLYRICMTSPWIATISSLLLAALLVTNILSPTLLKIQSDILHHMEWCISLGQSLASLKGVYS